MVLKSKVIGTATVVLAFLVVMVLTVSETGRPPRPGFVPGDPGRGGKLFYERGCADCHAIGGVGGKEATDLARSRGTPIDLPDIAGAMWNHAPTMWASMAMRDTPVPTLAPQDFMDLTAFLFMAGYLEEEGDSARGRALFVEKGCGGCHTFGAAEPKIGPGLVRWSSRMNPILWAALLWEHAPAMESAMRERDLSWPQLSPLDVADLLAFLRSLGSGADGTVPLPGDPWVGKDVFRRNCQRCHRTEGEGGDRGPDLGVSPATRTLSGLAASFWNHVPAMGEDLKEADWNGASFSEQEMADLITYLFAIRYSGVPGDASAGAAVYLRNCSTCHGKEGEGGEGPPLTSLGSPSSPPFIAASLWNHGPAMYAKVRELGQSWPLLRGNEMRDVIAYLGGLSSRR